MSDKAKELGTIAVNCVIVASIFALVGYRAITLEEAIAGVAVLLVPSAAPTLFTRVRDAIAARREQSVPPKGPSVLGVVLVVLAGVAELAACSPAKDARATSPPCAAEHLTVDECGARYQAELAACTARSSTRKESEACEDNLRARYGRPAREGGSQ